MKSKEKSPQEIEWFLEDLFLGSQWSIILGCISLPVGYEAVNRIIESWNTWLYSRNSIFIREFT